MLPLISIFNVWADLDWIVPLFVMTSAMIVPKPVTVPSTSIKLACKGGPPLSVVVVLAGIVKVEALISSVVVCGGVLSSVPSLTTHEIVRLGSLPKLVGLLLVEEY